MSYHSSAADVEKTTSLASGDQSAAVDAASPDGKPNTAVDLAALANELGVDQKKLMWKIDVRLVPMLCILYLWAFLDRYYFFRKDSSFQTANS